MNRQQEDQWAAIQARLRRGQGVHVALQDCGRAGIPVVAVIRHHLGRPHDERFNTAEDVGHLYGVASASGRRTESHL